MLQPEYRLAREDVLAALEVRPDKYDLWCAAVKLAAYAALPARVAKLEAKGEAE